jgi:GDP-4-dehydro-6-deoxy-D-mannose reductase
MRVLVTGAEGFVGRHSCAALRTSGHDVTELPGPGVAGGMDIRDVKELASRVSAARPDAVLHLAAVASVGASHRTPALTMDVNVVGTAALLTAVRDEAPGARTLVIGSGEVYGRAGDAPAPEETPIAPLSPYASSKAAAELVAFQFFRSYGVPVVCARSFNHLGAGQSADFVVPAFAAQLGAIRKGRAEPVLRIGELSPVRDFLHVDDVVRAYELLLVTGAPGEAYNVASGEGRSVKSLLDEMLELTGLAVRIEVDPERMRPVELPCLVGDASRLRALGWTPRLGIRDALREVLVEHGAL